MYGRKAAAVAINGRTMGGARRTKERRRSSKAPKEGEPRGQRDGREAKEGEEEIGGIKNFEDGEPAPWPDSSARIAGQDGAGVVVISMEHRDASKMHRHRWLGRCGCGGVVKATTPAQLPPSGRVWPLSTHDRLVASPISTASPRPGSH